MDLNQLKKEIDFEMYRGEMEEIIMDVVRRFLIPRFKDYGMEASGAWERSLHARGNELWGKSYTEQLQYGRLPGKFAPIEPLIQWVQTKLGYSGKEAVSVAWAINHKIKEEGTSWYQKGGTELMDVLYSQQVVDYFNERLSVLVRAKLELYVSSLLNDNFKR